MGREWLSSAPASSLCGFYLPSAAGRLHVPPPLSLWASSLLSFSDAEVFLTSSSLLNPHVPNCPQDLDQAKKQAARGQDAGALRATPMQQGPRASEAPASAEGTGKDTAAPSCARRPVLAWHCAPSQV